MLLRFAKNRNPLSLFVYVVDHVNCCGSVLSLIDNSESALTEIRRILKPRGTLFIEVESSGILICYGYYLIDCWVTS